MHEAHLKLLKVCTVFFSTRFVHLTSPTIFSFRLQHPSLLAMERLPILRGGHHDPGRGRRHPHVLLGGRQRLRGDRRLHGRVHRGDAWSAAVLQELQDKVDLRDEVSSLIHSKKGFRLLGKSEMP